MDQLAQIEQLLAATGLTGLALEEAVQLVREFGYAQYDDGREDGYADGWDAGFDSGADPWGDD